MPQVPSVSAYTVLFEDGFELGNASLWTATLTNGGGAVNVLAEQPHDGTYGAKVTTATSGDYGWLQWISPNSYNIISTRAYIKFDSLPNANYKFCDGPLFIYGSGGSPSLYTYMWHVPGGGISLSVIVYDNIRDIHGVGSFVVDVGRWYCFEVRWVVGYGYGVGQAKVFLDGQLVGGTSLGYPGMLDPSKQVRWGILSHDAGVPSATYFDDIVVATDYIGPERSTLTPDAEILLSSYGTRILFDHNITFNTLTVTDKNATFTGVQMVPGLQMATMTIDQQHADLTVHQILEGDKTSFSVTSPSGNSTTTLVLPAEPEAIFLDGVVVSLNGTAKSPGDSWAWNATTSTLTLWVLLNGAHTTSEWVLDYNPQSALPPGPSQNVIQVSDCTVDVVQGSSATASISVTWNFMGSVTLTQMTFQGAGSGWLGAPTLPLTLSSSGAQANVLVTVPSGTSQGSYTAQVSSQFTFGSGVQNVISNVNVNVVPAGSGGPGWWPPILPGLPDLGDLASNPERVFGNPWVISLFVLLIAGIGVGVKRPSFRRR